MSLNKYKITSLIVYQHNSTQFVNQVQDWFLDIAFVYGVSMHVCVSTLEDIHVNEPCMTS